MRAVAIVLALALIAVAIVYWVVSAGSLPSFVPGFEAGSDRVHMKHGIVAAVAAVVVFAIGWFAERARA
jgi:amino acid permease